MRKPGVAIAAVVLAALIGTTAFVMLSSKDAVVEDLSGPIATLDPTAEVVVDVQPGVSLDVLKNQPANEPDAPLDPITGDESDLTHNPEQKPVTDPGKSPVGLILPTSGSIIEGRTKMDGYNSHIAMEFKSMWEPTVKAVRASMEKSGWTCRVCVPFQPSPDANPDVVKNVKYMMEMANGAHVAIIVVAVTPEGSTASYTFQG